MLQNNKCIIIKELGRNRKSLVTCKLTFQCCIVTVVNNDPSLNNIKVSVGVSQTGSRGLTTIEGNSGITVRPNESYTFKTVKLFFDEELFIESTSKIIYVRTDILKECPKSEIVPLLDAI